MPLELRNNVGYMLRRSVEVPIVYGPARGRPRRKDRVLRLLDETTMPTDYEVIDELTLENLATIPQRKLVIYDSGSAWLSTFQVIKELLTDSTPVLLPSTELRHFAPLDAPELLVDLLNKFLPTEDYPAHASPAPAASAVEIAENTK